MAKLPRRPPQQLQPLKTSGYIRTSQEVIADSYNGPNVIPEALIGHNVVAEAYSGKDVTRPRDLYTFLSLGRIPTNPSIFLSKSSKADNNAETRCVKFAPVSETSTISSHADSGVKSFNGFNQQNRIPAIKAASTTVDEETNDEIDVDGTSGQEDASVFQSLINPDDHKISISKTYIFADPSRLQESLKYSKNAILPKIKPKKSVRISENYQRGKIDDDETALSLITQEMEPDYFNQVSRVRPECFFINTQLGEKNPFSRDTKASPSFEVPKASSGLQDLKDYDEYPDVYWQLRDGPIAQPADLEADMIDRDLYRLRQISTLKLNTIERTCQVKQDPFRKWRSKAGEPIFSPRQQQRPQHRLRKQNMRHTGLTSNVRVPSLKLMDNDVSCKTGDNLASTSRSFEVLGNAKSTREEKKDVTNGNDILSMSANNTPRDSARQTGRQEVMPGSTDIYMKLSGSNFDNQVPVQKLHEMKSKKEKQTIRTAVVSVDLESMDAYRREHRFAIPKRQISEPNCRSLNNSTNAYYLRKQLNESANLDSERYSNQLNNGERPTAFDSNAPTTNTSKSSSGNISARQTKAAPHLATVLFKPELDKISTQPSEPDTTSLNILCDNRKIDALATPTNTNAAGPPNTIDSASTITNTKEKRLTTTSPLKLTQLQVFAERMDRRDPIKIPTGRTHGRTTFLPGMPTYRLDLINYPPSNARQSCRRSNSAGMTESRQTHITSHTGLGSVHGHRVSTVKSDANTIPQRTGDSPSVSIRFGSKGEVIVSSSREGRQSR